MPRIGSQSHAHFIVTSAPVTVTKSNTLIYNIRTIARKSGPAIYNVAFTGGSNGLLNSGGRIRYGESFETGSALIGQTIDTWIVQLKQATSPSGPVGAAIYNSANTLVATANEVYEASQLPTSYTKNFVFTFNQCRTIAAADRLVITYAGAAVVHVRIHNTDQFDAALTRRTSWDGSSWLTSGTEDVDGIILSASPILRYKIRILTGQSTDILRYKIRTLTGLKTNTIRYKIRQLATNVETIRYNIRTLTGLKTNTLIYKIRKLTGLKTNILRYKIRTLTGQKTNILRYKIRKLATKAVILRYKIRQLATKPVILRYKIRQIATKPIIIRYKIRQVVTKQIITRYRILIKTGIKVNTLRYKIRTLTGIKTNIIRYKIRQVATRSYRFVYNIIVVGIVNRQVRLLYNIRQVARGTSIQKYNIRQLVGKYSILFDGVDDQITIPNIAAINNLEDFTISCWIYPITSWPVSTPHLFNKLYPSNNGFIVYFTANTFSLNFRTVNDTGVGVSATSTYMNTNGPNRWYHVLVSFVRSTGVMKIYINGIFRNSATNTGLLANSVGTVANLTINGGSGVKWGGYMRDFRLYRSDQSAEAVKIMNDDPTAPTPNYWLKMDRPYGKPVDSISSVNVANLDSGTTYIGGKWPTQLYKIRQVTGIKSNTLRYKIRQLARGTNTLRYKIRKLVTAPRTLRYKVRQLATKTNTLRYNIRQLVTRTNILRYRVKQIANKQVNIRYKIRQAAGRTNILRYKIRKLTGLKSMTLRYNINKLVRKDHILRYRILRLTGQKTIILRYAIKETVGNTFTGIYNIFGNIGSTITLRYRILINITPTLGTDIMQYLYNNWFINDPKKEDIS